jgi:GNAT superfamily N-acetyltransferase
MTLESANFGALAALWNRFYPPRYAVDEGMIRLNTVECPVLDWGASQVFEGEGASPKGFVFIKKSACPKLYKGPDPDQAHVSAIAFEDPVIGVDLMAAAKRNLRNRGVYRLVFGQDCRHFFPGCPEDFPVLRDFLRVEGFEETAPSFDLERDLADYRPPTADLPGDVAFRPLTDLDRAGLEAFLDTEFPGRWKFDTLSKADAEGDLAFVHGLFVMGVIQGFAVTQDASQKLPMAGAVWKQSLGPNWGTLGPIGVAAAQRGRGLGHALLGRALEDLQRRGVKRCLIDWTTLDKFYGAHGFSVERRYMGYALRLDTL